MKSSLRMVAMTTALVLPSLSIAQVGSENAAEKVDVNDTAKAANAAAERDPATPESKEALRGEIQQVKDMDLIAAEHHRASKVIGMNLMNQQDEKVGSVEDLIVDLNDRRVVAVIISSGGFLGIANELSVVPPSALQVNTEGKAFTGNFTKEQLTNAPRFQGTDYPDFNDRTFLRNVYEVYQAKPYLDALDRDRGEGVLQTQTRRASELLGMTVKNYQDDSIGSIHELVLSGNLDRVNSVVVSSGGFLGIGETLSVLPAGAITSTKDAVLVNATKETLQRSPRITADAWPERMNDPAYLVDVYSPYEYRANGDGEVNGNGKETDPVTAQQQSRNPGDLTLTTNIRKRLIADDQLSFGSQNIQVVSRDGKVSLLGQVSSKEEMNRIVEIAKDEAGPDLINNRLTVGDGR